MSFFKRIKRKVTDEIQDDVAEGAVEIADALLLRLDEVAPEISDLLTGEEVELHVSAAVKLQLKQKGES